MMSRKPELCQELNAAVHLLKNPSRCTWGLARNSFNPIHSFTKIRSCT